MDLRVHSVLVDTGTLNRFPELGEVFCYLTNALDNMVQDSSDLSALVSTVDSIVTNCVGGFHFEVKILDTDRDPVDPAQPVKDICLMLAERNLLPLH